MHRYDGKRRMLALAMTALAGLVDASGFLAADGYFVSFMSGNSTRLAVDLASGGSAALVPLGLIFCFFLGVTAGALLADRAGDRRKSGVLALVAALLALAAILRAWDIGFAYLALCALAMGAMNNSFRQEGSIAIGLTYMTGAIVRLGEGLAARLAGRTQTGWINNLALWLALVLGAASGAVLFYHWPYLVIWIAAGGAALLALAARRVERHNA